MNFAKFLLTFPKLVVSYIKTGTVFYISNTVLCVFYDKTGFAHSTTKSAGKG